MTHVRIGLAVGADRVAAHWVDARGADRQWAQVLGADRSLGDAIRELAGAVGDGPASVTVAILPPLARARNVSLPPMTARDRALVVARVPTRYFLGLSEPVAVEPESRGQVVHAVSEETLAMIESAVASVGWRVERIVSAWSAWRVAALKRWPAAKRGTHGIMVACCGEWATIIQADGVLQVVRRGREPGHDAGTLVLADNAAAAADEAAVFARHAGVELVSSHESRRRAATGGRVARRLAVAAAALLVAAAGVRHVGLMRERDAILAQRAALRSRVGAAMSDRDSVARVASVIMAIGRLEQSAPRWSAVVARAAAALPARSSLVSLRAEGDSARIEGEADDATGVFTRLQRAPGLLSLKPVGAIRQESGPDARTVERWTVSTRVDHRRAVRGDR